MGPTRRTLTRCSCPHALLPSLQPDIRPPGWATNPDRKPLEGGARSCRCALCPIKYGAFKRAADGQRWVHSVRCCEGAGGAAFASPLALQNVEAPAAPHVRFAPPCLHAGLRAVGARDVPVVQ